MANTIHKGSVTFVLLQFKSVQSISALHSMLGTISCTVAGRGWKRSNEAGQTRQLGSVSVRPSVAWLIFPTKFEPGCCRPSAAPAHHYSHDRPLLNPH